MENTTYYYESEKTVFLTDEDARKYFFEEELYHSVSVYLGLNEFLSDKGYNHEDIFYLDSTEKADILSDYHEALFQFWVREELTECYMYE